MTDQGVNRASDWRGELSKYFDVFVNTRRERRRIFCTVFLIAFLYALFNDLALHRAPQRIAWEIVILCIGGTITLPFLYVGYRVSKERRFPALNGWRWATHRPFALLASASFSLAIVGFCQTQLFVSLLPYPRAQVLNHREKASLRQSEIQSEYRARTGNEPLSFVEYRSFSPSVQVELKESMTYLISDERLNTKLKESFGVTLRDTKAVIIPSWEVEDRAGATLVGLTLSGWTMLSSRSISDEHGVVIRDTGDQSEQLTTDGVPRIVLSASAFQDPKTLRLTLFHELLHALNIPGYSPSRVVALQDDLTYLPEYRSIVRQEKLRGWTEYNIWFFGVILPFTYSFFNLTRILKSIPLSKGNWYRTASGNDRAKMV